jgi:hypothetical protein
MLNAKTHKTVASLVIGAACLALPAFAAAPNPLKLAGTIAGVVSDAGGTPQMGATVVLYNRQERPLQKIQTNERGEFHFAGLFPEFYSVRVSLATFFPAFKRGVLVQPGMRSMLSVSLNTLFSTIQLSYPVAIDSGSIMSDEWKWVLRGSASTRPVLRLLGAPPLAGVTVRNEHAAVFSDTRGMLRVSAGDGSIASAVSNEADMGTAFALATSVYGNNLLQVSGNLGYGSQTGVPSAAFRTSYSRSFAGGNPEVSLTMRQLFLPARLGPAMAGNDAALPMLRTMSAGLDDRKQIADNVTIQYGFTLDSVTFLDRLNYFSPYSRVTWSMPDGGNLEFAYTSGNARPDLGSPTAEEAADLQHDLSTLGMFPRISMVASRPKIQRGEEYEAAYSRKAGSRTYRVSAYYEMVRNASLSLLAPDGLFPGGDILPDLFTGNSTFNMGDLHNSGFDLSVTQDLGEHLSATVFYGSDGTMTVENRELISNNPDELRAMIRAGRKHAATARITAAVPHSGTRLVASYQWSGDQRWLLSGNLYSTQSNRPMPGLNILVRQPLPRMGGLPWRMEATAELRNMLAQGYVPINAAGQRLLLFDTPRSLRGGLSFIF